MRTEIAARWPEQTELMHVMLRFLLLLLLHLMVLHYARLLIDCVCSLLSVDARAWRCSFVLGAEFKVSVAVVVWTICLCIKALSVYCVYRTNQIKRSRVRPHAYQVLVCRLQHRNYSQKYFILLLWGLRDRARSMLRLAEQGLSCRRVHLPTVYLIMNQQFDARRHDVKPVYMLIEFSNLTT